MNLELQELSKVYGALTVLDRVSLRLEGISSLVLIGPSGGGKTTLLRLLSGLEPPTGGRVVMNGHHLDHRREEELRGYRRRVGMVFQAYNLFPHLSALENITLPLVQVHGVSPLQAEGRARELLERFQLADQAPKKPSRLSGGQQQRIAICRAAAIQPEFLLLDEPTSALDPEYTTEVLDLIAELRREGMQILLVTHEMGFARQVAEHVLFVADGGLPAQGPPEEVFERPPTPRVQRFLDQVLKYN